MATAEIANKPNPRGSYTRNIIREHLAEHLTNLFRQTDLSHLSDVSRWFPGDFGARFDKDHLPHRPDAPSKDLPAGAKVCIIGAGMAGLYSAMILDHLGIPYDILEASQRPGGRVHTHYFSTKKHDYYDIGAMRFPNIPPMWRTFDLFERVKAPLRDYYLGGKNCPKSYNGISKYPKDGENIFLSEPDPFKLSQSNGGSIPDHMIWESTKVLEKAFGPYKEAIVNDDESAWSQLRDVDELTVRDYLKKKMNLDFYTIQWLEETDSATGLFDLSFTESVLDSIAFDYGPGDEEWKCVEGGTSVVVDKMLETIKTRPTYNKRVTRIAIDRNHTQDENKMVVVSNYDEPPQRYASVICSTTLACLQRIDTNNLELSSAQKVALRTLHYDSSTKVGIKFDHPWWITECGITQGGVSNTDLPIRVCVYPSYNVDDPTNQNSVLLATYTWAQDATRIGSLVNTDSPRGEEELKGLMLYNLARLHSTDEASFERLYDIIKKSYITHYGWDWAMDDFSSGAYAMFAPGQFRYLYPHLIRPAADARLHIVGEAASSNHAWIVGALESAYRGIWLFLERFGCRDLQTKMEKEFGSIPELDVGETGYAHLLVLLGMLKPQLLAASEGTRVTGSEFTKGSFGHLQQTQSSFTTTTSTTTTSSSNRH